MKRQATDWRIHLQITYLTKDFYPECVNNSQNPAVRQQTTQFLEDLNEYFTNKLQIDGK